jgi:recombinational DNA repair ATPase RecF
MSGVLILLHFNKLDDLTKEVLKLEAAIGKTSRSYQTLMRIKSELLAKQGRLPEAIDLIEKRLAKYPANHLDRIKTKLRKLAT